MRNVRHGSNGARNALETRRRSRPQRNDTHKAVVDDHRDDITDQQVPHKEQLDGIQLVPELEFDGTDGIQDQGGKENDDDGENYPMHGRDVMSDDGIAIICTVPSDVVIFNTVSTGVNTASYVITTIRHGDGIRIRRTRASQQQRQQPLQQGLIQKCSVCAYLRMTLQYSCKVCRAIPQVDSSQISMLQDVTISLLPHHVHT